MSCQDCELGCEEVVVPRVIYGATTLGIMEQDPTKFEVTETSCIRRRAKKKIGMAQGGCGRKYE